MQFSECFSMFKKFFMFEVIFKIHVLQICVQMEHKELNIFYSFQLIFLRYEKRSFDHVYE